MKKQMNLPLLALGGGIAAFVLRLLQNRTGFEDATGLPIPRAPFAMLLAGALVLLAVLLFVFSRQLPNPREDAASFPADFSTSSGALLTLLIGGSLLIGVSGLADLYEGFTGADLLVQLQTAADPYAVVESAAAVFSARTQQLLGALSLIFAAALIPAAAACHRREDPRPFSGSLLLVPPVVLVIRLVLTYRLDSINPSLEAYYVEILALVFLTLAFYYLAAFAFASGHSRRFAFCAGSAVVLCCATLADGGPHLSSLLLYAGGAATLMGFLLLRLSSGQAE